MAVSYDFLPSIMHTLIGPNVWIKNYNYFAKILPNDNVQNIIFIILYCY